MTASPALARDWGWGGRHHHRDRVDAGDIFAGILVIGGIAAIASAAGKSAKEKREQDNRYPDTRNDREDSGSDDYGRDDSGRYGSSRGSSTYGGVERRAATDVGGAVDSCVAEVERGDRRVDSVESVNRDGEGWRVEGRMSNGRDFSCSADRDGRIRRVTVDGTAI